MGPRIKRRVLPWGSSLGCPRGWRRLSLSQPGATSRVLAEDLRLARNHKPMRRKRRLKRQHFLQPHQHIPLYQQPHHLHPHPHHLLLLYRHRYL
ncbi:hypothetical protein FKM82_003715 [Ascaphus truei]